MRGLFVATLVVGLATAASAAAPTLLPIKQGRYAPAETPCEKATNDLMLVYDGQSVRGPQLNDCRATASNVAPRTYRLAQTCQSSAGAPAAEQDLIFVVSGLERFSVGPVGQTRERKAYRFCSPEHLPELIRPFVP